MKLIHNGFCQTTSTFQSHHKIYFFCKMSSDSNRRAVADNSHEQEDRYRRGNKEFSRNNTKDSQPPTKRYQQEGGSDPIQGKILDCSSLHELAEITLLNLHNFNETNCSTAFNRFWKLRQDRD